MGHLPIFFGRFEHENGAVRWTAACRRLDGGNTIPDARQHPGNESPHSDQKPLFSSENRGFCHILTLLFVCRVPLFDPANMLINSRHHGTDYYNRLHTLR